jgi:hypothetical protein
MNAQSVGQPAPTTTGEIAPNVVRLADAARIRRSRPAHVRAVGRYDSGSALADTDVDHLVHRFLNSPYSSDDYAVWPFDRRLEGFLKHRGLGNLADNGDAFATICERVMTSISRQRSRGSGSR